MRIRFVRPAASAAALLILAAVPVLSGPTPVDKKPVVHWAFEDNQPDSTRDVAGGVRDAVDGSFTPVAGVSGRALRLDGYTFSLERPADKAPVLGPSFTVDAWVAQAAYPWNWAPVIAQMKKGVRGFYFGVGPRGQFGMDLVINDELHRCLSDDFALPLREWHHIAAVVKEGDGVYLYLDGEPVAHTPLKKRFAPARRTPLRMGQNEEPVKPSHQIGDSGNLPFWYSVDGILDEVRVFDAALPAERLQADFQSVGRPSAPELPVRKLPTGPKGDFGFGAFYTRLEYYPEWDARWPVGDHPDVVVTFPDSPVRMIFWRGTRYSPAWISETGLWMADQSVEAWNDAEGCFEHMQDPKCLYSHVRIIENTPARIVVHWRYAPLSAYNHFWRVDEKTGWGVWVDEYYIIHPDATAVRHVTWKSGTLGFPRQFQESLPLTDPLQKRGEIMDVEWVSVANLAGETQVFEYVDDPPEKNDKPIPESPSIQRHNFTSRFDPFIVFEPGNKMRYLKDRARRVLDAYGSCNHWPVGQPHCDGRRAQTGDRPTHFLGFPISTPVVHEDEGRSWWAGIYGMTEKPISDLVRLGRSWARPAGVEAVSGPAGFAGWETPQRAFVFEIESNNPAPISWTWAASPESPLVRPLVILKSNSLLSGNITGIEVDGKPLEAGRGYRTGEVRGLKENRRLIWLNLEGDAPTTLKIKRGEH